ncbi:uncharacterized protein [Littorina saxatilis]
MLNHLMFKQYVLLLVSSSSSLRWDRVYLINKMTSCGSTICYDDNAYCCEDDAGYETCCVSYYYYQTWWFWFMWGIFLLILVSCFVGCFRMCRRRSQPRYVILGGSQQPPVYGSVVVSSNMRSSATMMPQPTAPVAPPAYAAYPQEKPPAYAPAPPHAPARPQGGARNM